MILWWFILLRRRVNMNLLSSIQGTKPGGLCRMYCTIYVNYKIFRPTSMKIILIPFSDLRGSILGYLQILITNDDCYAMSLGKFWRTETFFGKKWILERKCEDENISSFFIFLKFQTLRSIIFSNLVFFLHLKLFVCCEHN